MSAESCTFSSANFDTKLETAAVPADLAPAVLRTIRKLVEGQPVSRSDVGIEDVAVWDELKSLGAEVDDADRIVALGGLSIRPTRHRFVVGDRELFAWCALDTLFPPHLLDETAGSWLADHSNAVIVPLEEAFRIGRETCSLPLLEGASCDC